jgi:hypothetical protein
MAVYHGKEGGKTRKIDLSFKGVQSGKENLHQNLIENDAK